MFICPSSKAKESYYERAGYGFNWWIGEDGSNVSSLGQMGNSSEIVFCCDAPATGAICAQFVYPSLIIADGMTSKSMRHNGGCNFTFCDGHAKYFKDGQGPSNHSFPAYGGTTQYWDPKYYNN